MNRSFHRLTFQNFKKNIGPGPLVAAAFIGPGTVTICSIAGLEFGYSLLWALSLSIFSTIILQEMASRLGIVSRKGLSNIIRSEIKNTGVRKVTIFLILSAIVVGNGAYEAGNISGGVLGLEAIFGNSNFILFDFNLNTYSFLTGLIAFAVLASGNYNILEKSLIFLVLLMSISFAITALISKPNIFDLFNGILIPQIPSKSTLIIIGLIGTTVVPYNLFLHAALSKEKWKKKSDLKYAKKDTTVSIILGGIISMCIVISSSSLNIQEITSAIDLAKGVEPIYGSSSKYILGLGLFSAGVTSAITAPLAASYVASGCLGWSGGTKNLKFKLVWFVILFFGVISSSSGLKSIDIIKFAQISNGLLLPIVAGFLIWIANKESILGDYKNTNFQNIAGLLILLLTIFLGSRSIFNTLNLI